MSNDFIPYGRPVVSEEDVGAVADVLRGDWLTTGPRVGQFERAFAEYVGAEHAVAVSNGTAALHLAMLTLGIGVGDEVIVPALTFAASANCVRYVGATVVFADVREDFLTIDVGHVASLINSRTKAIVAVDYAGLPADLDELRALATKHGLALVEDGCHAPGAEYKGRRIGSIADMTTFSFHPVKHLTTAEGGMVTTNEARFASQLRVLRNHGISTDHRQREEQGTWEYDMTTLGYNYRLTDVQSALGLSQLQRQAAGLAHRSQAAARYTRELAGLPLHLPETAQDRTHAWHLYPVRIQGARAELARRQAYNDLRKRGVGVNVHYRPVYLHSYYRTLGYQQGLCPVAERAYGSLLSLPMWHGMTDIQQTHVISAVQAVLGRA